MRVDRRGAPTLVSAESALEAPDSMDGVYRLNIREIWRRLRQEPLHFWLFCGYVFFEYVRPHNIYPAIAFLPWPKLFLLGALLAVLFDSRENKSLQGPLTLPVLSFFLVVFISFGFAFMPAQSLDKADVLVNWVIAYLLFLWCVNSRFRLFIVFLLLLLASFKMAQHGFRVAASRGFAFASYGVAGPSGWFSNAADLGVQMTIYISWAIAFYFGLKGYWRRWWVKGIFAFFIVAGLVTAISTNQRNTVIALAVMALAFVVFSRNRIRNLVLIALVGAAGYGLASAEFKDRFVDMEQSGTALARMDFWERGLGFYKEHPVIGVGYNNYQHYYAMRYPGDTNYKGLVMVAHSVPVTIAAETGSLGIIFFSLVVIAVFLTNWRSARIFRGTDPPFWRYFALSLNYGLIGFLVTGIFVSTAFYPFLWFQAGLSAALYRVASRERELEREGHGICRHSTRVRPDLSTTAISPQARLEPE